jgi:uncharacterized protein
MLFYRFIPKLKTFKDRQFRKIATFLIITFLLTFFFNRLIALFKPESSQDEYILGIVWSPGFAALITRYLYRKEVTNLGWSGGSFPDYSMSYLIPFLYTLLAYLTAWTLGIGSFYNAESMQVIAKNYGWEALPQGMIVILYLIFSSTLGIIKACPYALGEELGWRGFLVPELAKTTTFANTALISGSAWAVWHYPTIIFGGYNNGKSIPFSLLAFTIAVLAISFPMAWLRLKSGSVWTGVIFHASDNLFIENVFSNLTKETEFTNYFVGEFGIFIALFCLIPAYVFWKKRKELKLTHNS